MKPYPCRLWLAALAAAAIAQAPVHGGVAIEVPEIALPPSGWALEAQILARIHAPQFPDRVFPITQYGAAPGGQDCTAAIRQAIEACHAAGGGRVLVPAGDFNTGAIRLLGNVDLEVAKGATLHFSTDPKAYLPAVPTRWEGTECMNYSALVYAYGQENIAVTGEGTLDGGASDSNWWGWAHRGPNHQPAPAMADIKLLNALSDQGVPPEQRVFGAGHKLRPNFIQTYRCRNVLIEGVTIHRSPMWEIHPVLSQNVIVRGVTIATLGTNNDGCDPESCRDVLIDDCTFATGDDCIAIKSGRNNDGRRLHVPVENVIVRHCRMEDGHAGVAIGSEISGGCRDVFVDGCSMDSPHLDRMLRLKSNAVRGGFIDHVYVRDVQIGHVTEAVLTVDFLYEEGAKGNFPPRVSDVDIENVTGKDIPRVLWIGGIPQGTVGGIRLANCVFHGVTLSDRVQYAGSIVFDHVQILSPQGFHSENSRPAQPQS